MPFLSALLKLNRNINRFLLVDSAATFHSEMAFPNLAPLKERWREIREEAMALITNIEELPKFDDISPRQKRISDIKWRTFFFKIYGLEVCGCSELCPITTRLLREVSGVETAMFSILMPGKHIPPHRGIDASVLRYHLGLVTPSVADGCFIRVGKDTRSWHDGTVLIFDDTHEHEVRNDTTEMRIVLFIDVLRPMSRLLAAYNKILRICIRHFSSDVRFGLRRAEAYTRRIRNNRFPCV